METDGVVPVCVVDNASVLAVSSITVVWSVTVTGCVSIASVVVISMPAVNKPLNKAYVKDTKEDKKISVYTSTDDKKDKKEFEDTKESDRKCFSEDSQEHCKQN